MKFCLLAISLLWGLYYATGKSLEIFGFGTTARKLKLCCMHVICIVGLSLLPAEQNMDYAVVVLFVFAQQEFSASL